MRWVGVLLLVAAPLVVCAPQNGGKKSDEQVYELGAGIAPPRVTHQVNPQYPENLRGVRVEGVVGIGVVVTSKGIPDNPQVVKSLDKQVDRCAVEAVKQWRFAPAQKQGKPVAVRIMIELEFHSM
jgi:protein TonB